MRFNISVPELQTKPTPLHCAVLLIVQNMSTNSLNKYILETPNNKTVPPQLSQKYDWWCSNLQTSANTDVSMTVASVVEPHADSPTVCILWLWLITRPQDLARRPACLLTWLLSWQYTRITIETGVCSPLSFSLSHTRRYTHAVRTLVHPVEHALTVGMIVKVSVRPDQDV